MDAARLFCFGFDGLDVPDDILFALDRDGVGAVILFARNCRDGPQLRALCRRLREAGGDELWILVDQEGGRVRRITVPDIGPPAAADLARRTPTEVEEAYLKVARQLAELGIDFNLAPVADVTTAGNPVVRDRSFGDDATAVAGRVAAAVRGQRRAGLKCCAKHFPGLGDVSTDPHLERTRSDASAALFHSHHFIPFAAAMQSGVSAIMTTHLLAPALDPNAIATYSPVITDRLLQVHLGFDGLVLTDDLEMKGLPDDAPVAAWKAFEAGHHLLLMCHTHAPQVEALQLFRQRLSGDAEARRKIHAALDRQQPLRTPFQHAPA